MTLTLHSSNIAQAVAQTVNQSGGTPRNRKSRFLFYYRKHKERNDFVDPIIYYLVKDIIKKYDQQGKPREARTEAEERMTKFIKNDKVYKRELAYYVRDTIKQKGRIKGLEVKDKIQKIFNINMYIEFNLKKTRALSISIGSTVFWRSQPRKIGKVIQGSLFP